MISLKLGQQFCLIDGSSCQKLTKNWWTACMNSTMQGFLVAWVHLIQQMVVMMAWKYEKRCGMYLWYSKEKVANSYDRYSVALIWLCHKSLENLLCLAQLASRGQQQADSPHHHQLIYSVQQTQSFQLPYFFSRWVLWCRGFLPTAFLLSPENSITADESFFAPAGVVSTLSLSMDVRSTTSSLKLWLYPCKSACASC